MRRLAAAFCAAFCLAAAARADIFSPGPLAHGHAKLEGLNNCTQCHVAGAQLSNQRCLDCHTEIRDRVAKHEGFHGRISDADRTCNKCHHDHQGRDFELIDWGKKGKKGFDHKSTGFALNGKHAQIDCAQCHEKRLIVDKGIRDLLSTHAGRDTHLGLGTRCSDCHFDEHRGQLGTSCSDCHNERSWKPAPRFDHARTAFPLQGKHAGVECLSCHAKERDPAFVKDAFPAPRAETFSRMKPVAHASCLECHEDPHANKFGQDCQSCHTVQGWLVLNGTTREREFHEKTHFPLRGAHATVACKSCHGPFPGVKAKFKGLAFSSCTSCHVDAHLGQLGKPGSSAAACDTCHTEQGFRPARFEAKDHVSWPLLGAHEAVACVLCHRAEPKLEARASPIRAWILQRGRKDAISLTQFHPSGDVARCDACHADPHAGQFAKRVKKAGCADCHEVASWVRVRFDHDRETRFALTGTHSSARCESCHVADEGGVMRFAKLGTTCASCHADVHAGQFAAARGGAVDCERCHTTAAWERTTFQHRPPFTSFALQGKHASVGCADCHREVVVAARVRTRQYRGVPQSCEGCHVDVHRGTFRELAQ